MQVEAGGSKLLLFETFSFNFFSSHERFLEELALLKMVIFVLLCKDAKVQPSADKGIGIKGHRLDMDNRKY